MNFAQQQNSSSRVTGFVIVVLIHVVLVWAIASGLARKAIEKVVGPLEVKVVEEVKPPPPPENLPPPPPQLKAPPPPFVPPPEVQVTAPAPIAPTITQTTSAPPPVQDIRPVQAPVVVAAPPPPRPAGPVKAGIACTKMATPEVPGMNWAGEATFNVKATVKNNKVVSIEVVSANMRGGNDRKAQRAMVGAIEAAMSSYECPGAELQIQQEFVFKID